MTTFAFTIFLSAFLLFQVQPILGKTIVPAFGGGAGVWTACMIFFQVMLLAGYAYAHWLSSKLAVKRQVWAHALLLGISLWWLRITADAASWQPDDVAMPTMRILFELFGHVGLPYLLLSATGPLLQRWFARTYPGRSPYRLYALSNAGSLLALLSYPFVFESSLPLHAQGQTWAIAYFVFAGACALAGRRFAGANCEADGQMTERRVLQRPPMRVLGKWTLLAALGSVILIATTNAQSQDMAATPLLWVVPLAAYLLTFILCFEHDRWYRREIFVPLIAIGLALVAFADPTDMSIVVQLVIYTATLFAACMVCHGELAHSRPDDEQLTTFYLTVALGGALGGMFVGLVAPLVFTDYWEYPIGLLLVIGLAVWLFRSERVSLRRLRALGLGATVLLAGAVFYVRLDRTAGYIDSRRSFYGVLHVQRARVSGQAMTEVAHGVTRHGMQLLERDKRRWPTTYYGRESGIGVTITALRHLLRSSHDLRGLRIGVIGLGAGTIAAMTGEGDYLRFYEINPDVEDIARKHFSFLADTKAKTDVVIGDARIVLAREAARGEYQRFDVLVVDAFNSDSIPAHLMTREALRIYESHLHPITGVVAFHVSNRHLDLGRVVRGIAGETDFEMHYVASPGEPQRVGTSRAKWALVSRYRPLLDHPRVRLAAELEFEDEPVVWTDQRSSVLSVLRSSTPPKRRWLDAPNQGRFVIDQGRLLAREHQDFMLWRMRQLYADSHGAKALVIGTVDKLPSGLSGESGLDAYTNAAFQQLGLATADSLAIVIMIQRDGKTVRMSAKLGNGWSEGFRKRAKQEFQNGIAAGLRKGDFSYSIATGTQALERAMHSEGPGSQVARPGR